MVWYGTLEQIAVSFINRAPSLAENDVAVAVVLGPLALLLVEMFFAHNLY